MRFVYTRVGFTEAQYNALKKRGAFLGISIASLVRLAVAIDLLQHPIEEIEGEEDIK